MNRKMIMALLSSAVCFGQVYASDIWRIGTDDGAAAEFALAPSGYEDFLAKDFGYEDRYYLIGHSDLKSDFRMCFPVRMIRGAERGERLVGELTM